MFKIKKNTIHCSRGESGTMTLRIPITDENDYIKYEDISHNIYWYDITRNKLYDSNYEETTVSIDALTMVLYNFVVGDEIKFNIYERNGYDKEPLVSKKVIVETAGTSVDIPLTDEETTFGEISNKSVTYWYDVSLNEYSTVICYNEDGAKEFIQYPAKGRDE